MSDIETKVWAFMYNWDIYDSAAEVISLHRTKKGARKAMLKHKKERLKEFNDYNARNPNFADNKKFGWHEWWGVKEFEIQD